MVTALIDEEEAAPVFVGDLVVVPTWLVGLFVVGTVGATGAPVLGAGAVVFVGVGAVVLVVLVDPGALVPGLPVVGEPPAGGSVGGKKIDGLEVVGVLADGVGVAGVEVVGGALDGPEVVVVDGTVVALPPVVGEVVSPVTGHTG